MKTPNIIIIMDDQHHGGVIGGLGVPGLKTPQMDRLLEQGVYFDKAYCTNPICVPSRTSMLTGKMPNEIDVDYNKDDLGGPDYDFPVLGDLLKGSGYRSSYLGKTHVVGGAERGFDHYRHIEGKENDHLLSGAAIEFIEEQSDKPFFIVASYHNPHDICQWARGQELPEGPIGLAPENLEELPPLHDNFAIADDEPDVIRYVKKLHKGVYPSQDWDEKKWRQYIWAYHRLIEKVDHDLGELTNYVEKSSHADNTVIIFVSDHGDGYGSHQWNQKSVLYEEPLRVPFIIVDPQSKKRNEIDKQNLVSTGLDLIPTICDYAGVAVPKDLRGQSLKPLMYGQGIDRTYISAQTEFADYDRTYNIKGRVLRTLRYKYIVYDVGDKKEQFFDLENDPGEMNNLVGTADYRDLLIQHRQALQAYGSEISDHFILPNITPL